VFLAASPRLCVYDPTKNVLHNMASDAARHRLALPRLAWPISTLLHSLALASAARHRLASRMCECLFRLLRDCVKLIISRPSWYGLILLKVDLDYINLRSLHSRTTGVLEYKLNWVNSFDIIINTVICAAPYTNCSYNVWRILQEFSQWLLIILWI